MSAAGHSVSDLDVRPSPREGLFDASLSTRHLGFGLGAIFGGNGSGASPSQKITFHHQNQVAEVLPGTKSTNTAHILSSRLQPLQSSTGRFERCASAICKIRKREVA